MVIKFRFKRVKLEGASSELGLIKLADLRQPAKYWQQSLLTAKPQLRLE
jgi:hypothetical protein